MTKAAGSLTSLRERNRCLVLAAIQTRRAVTRIDIARATGLSRTTVSSLVADLIADSIVVELDERPPGPTTYNGFGRPPIGLALHPDTGAVVGVHLHHDGVRVALSDLNGSLLGEAQRDSDVDHQPADSLDYAAATVQRLIDDAGIDPARVAAMGVAVAAPVQTGSHVLTSPSTMDDWSHIDIAAVLHDRTALPVHIGNDANLGALAESKFGVGRGIDDLIYVMLSDGVGAGLVLRGQVYEGASGAAGELGHVAVATDGYICRCGNRGCLETVAGSRALIDALAHSRGPETTLEDVLQLAAADDPGARRAVTDAGRAVGRALAGIVTILDPKMIIIGGKVAAAGRPLVEGIRDVLAVNLPPVTNQTIQVVAGELKDRAEVYGAIAIASEAAMPHLLGIRP